MPSNQVLIIDGGYRRSLAADRPVGIVPGAAEYTLRIGDPTLTARLPEVAARGGQLVVCGVSLNGIEAATEFAEIYPDLRISLVTATVFGAKLSVKGQVYLRKSFKRLGIEILDQLAVMRVSQNALHFDGGRPMPFDVAVWAAP